MILNKVIIAKNGSYKSGLMYLTKCNNSLVQYILKRKYESYSYPYIDPDYYIRSRIGNRETVGYGICGRPGYSDRVDYPFPSIRYMPPTPEILALREKEKGDWNILSIKEKKQLYRASYCQTFREFEYPTGEWMFIIGGGFIVISIGIWLSILMTQFVYKRTPLPDSFKLESLRQQLVRRLQMYHEPISGISSMWDYEKNQWKGGVKPRGVLWNNPFDEKECIEPY